MLHNVQKTVLDTPHDEYSVQLFMLKWLSLKSKLKFLILVVKAMDISSVIQKIMFEKCC